MSRRKREENFEIDDELVGSAAQNRKRRRRRRPPRLQAGAPAIPQFDVLAGDQYLDMGSSEGCNSTVMVTGLDPDYTVLDLKARMEMYGSVSRIRIDGNEGIGYVRYRTPDHARAAIAASANHLPAVTIDDPKVSQENVSVPQWQPGTAGSSQSNLLRSEISLRRRGRENKLLTRGRLTFDPSGSNTQPNDRQIVAYDDIL